MFPFAAVVGADEAKLALLLAAVEPRIGGVLLRGEKGSAKSTLARGLAALLPGAAPFVDLPVGATEDRVIGSLDVAAALTGGDVRFRAGLLAAADGGILYVDEVNLLPDHLVDALLDVAASGVNRVEREGVAHQHPSRFLLLGSMNPEEGELRPQFLDRFGLCVDVAAPRDPEQRGEAVRRRLAFDDGRPVADAGDDAELAARLAAARSAGPAALGDDLIEAVGAVCVAAGVDGLRADLVICRAASALARWEGRAAVSESDVRRVAPLALAHRARRGPMDAHGMSAPDLAAALDAGFGQGSSPESVVEGAEAPVVRLAAPPSAAPAPAGGRRSVTVGERGRLVGDRPVGPAGLAGGVAIGATVRAAAGRGAVAGEAAVVQPEDVREAVRAERAGNLIVLAVDASGSMGAERRMEVAKGAVLGLLVDAYQRRDRVALVTFGGEDASIVVRPTGSVEVARARLQSLPTGGRTPLAAGITTALELASASGSGHRPLLVFVTDGRATAAGEGGADPVDAARAAAAAVRRRGVPAVVVDAEEGASRLGLAAELAAIMGARCLTLPELTAPALVGAVRAAG